ncbi:MAG: DUF4388 domain-containing protein [Ktedonobacteraceae bacterium]
MSFIRALEQLHLPEVLQGIEAHSKTGLLIIQQDAQWVEFYFRNGRLMCIGPVRADAPLEKRLLQAGVISPQALREALQAIAMPQPGETRLVITLMDLGYTSREDLRAWAMREATDVLRVLLQWRSGEIRFEDEIQPQNDPLLVALSPNALLAACAVSAPEQPLARVAAVSPVLQQAQPQPTFSAPTSSAMPGRITASQLLTDATGFPDMQPIPESPLPSADVLFDGGQFTSPDTNLPAQPVWVTTPATPPRINTSFMRPEMVLIPADLSNVREQNPQLQLTPDQWHLLTRVDGQASLQMMCQVLALPSDFVCSVAGELIAQGLLRIITPVAQTPFELSPVSRDMITAGLGNGYVSPGAAAATAQPWAAISPTTDALPPSFALSAHGVPFETVSQWGNGGNGATFVPGRGWVTGPQSVQPVQSSGPLTVNNGAYSNVGGGWR